MSVVVLWMDDGEGFEDTGGGATKASAIGRARSEHQMTNDRFMKSLR